MADLEKQIELVYKWLLGKFDNNYQYITEKERDGDPTHDPVFSRFFAVDAPKFGAYVLVARQGLHETDQVYRQRIYALQINSEEGCVMNQIYRLKDESWFDKIEKDPTSAVHLDPLADAECMEGCGVYWTFLPEENRFHAATKEDTCRFESKLNPGKTVIANSDIYLSSTELWTRDRIVDTDGNKLFGFKSDEHHKYRRCEMYKGKAEYDGGSEEVSVHNQGGKVNLGNGVTIVLEEAFDFVMNCKILRLSFLKADKQIGVAFFSCDATTIGAKFDSVKVILDKLAKS
uniref:Uncharacterized protein n=1 Tax=Amphimedon queenslandica TaxID=400682 RepID=A0A1X7VBR9_AMPQE